MQKRKEFLIVVILLTISFCTFNTYAKKATLEIKEKEFLVLYPGYIDYFLNKCEDYSVMDTWPGASIKIFVEYNDSKPVKIRFDGQENYSGTANVLNYVLLSDTNNINEFLIENKIRNVEKIQVMQTDLTIGYIMYVKTDKDVYFIPFSLNNDKAMPGGFSDRRIYTAEEFKKVCAPREVTMTILGKELNSDQKAIMGYGRAKVPMRAVLQELGYSVEWDNKQKSIIFSKGENTYTYVTDFSINTRQVVLKNGEKTSYWFFSESINNRLMGDEQFIQFIERIEKIRFNIDLYNYKIEIVKLS